MAECGDRIRWEWSPGSYHQGTCTKKAGHGGTHEMVAMSSNKKPYRLTWEAPLGGPKR